MLLDPPPEVIIILGISVLLLVIYTIAVTRAGGPDYLAQDIRAFFTREPQAPPPADVPLIVAEPPQPTYSTTSAREPSAEKPGDVRSGNLPYTEAEILELKQHLLAIHAFFQKQRAGATYINDPLIDFFGIQWTFEDIDGYLKYINRGATREE